MTKIEIITQLIAAKEIEREAADAIVAQLEQSRTDTLYDVVDGYFSGAFTLDDVYIKKPASSGYSSSSYEVKRPQKDTNYDKELMTIRLNKSWSSPDYEKIETSMYSTSDNSQFELERIFTNGEVAKVLLDHGDDMLAEINAVNELDSKEINDARTALYKIENDIASLKTEINDIEINQAENKLSGEGLVFGEGKKGAMDLRWDWTIRGINSAKILSKTASGKSCNIEIQAYDNEPQVYEKVRMSNVEALIWQYRDYVINA